MKHTLYISSLLAACMLLFSCAADNSAIPENGFTKSAVVNLSLSTGADTRANGALPTDNGSVVGSNEGKLNHICVGLFDANNKLVTLYEYDYKGDENVSTRTDAVQMLVFANVPVGAFAGKYVLSDFYTVAQDLGYTTSADGKTKTAVTTANSQSMTSLPMMSDVKALDWGSGTTLSPTVTLNRMVARVALTNISYSFSGSYSGCTFTPTEVFMYNASNQLTNWNTKTVNGSVSGENIAGNANTVYLGSGTISSFSGLYYFYVFPNSNITTPTKLVIKGTFKTKSGTTYTTYYPITVNSSSPTGNIVSTITGGTGDSKISANTTYGLSVTLNGTGVANVSDEITTTSVTVNTSVDNFTNATIAEHFGPAVGDIYYSDGTYSNNYYASKTPLGIIVSTNPIYCESANGYGHGLVMALTNVAGNVCWGLDKTQNVVTPAVTAAEMKADVSGLSKTNTIKSTSGYETSYPAFYKALTYTLKSPNSSSGWFLPSAGQWYEALCNAQTYYNANNSQSQLLIPYGSWYDLVKNIGTGQAGNCATEINYLFTSKNLNSLYENIRPNSGAVYLYWSSTPKNDNDANSVNFELEELSINNPGEKTDTNSRYVRAFLAF